MHNKLNFIRVIEKLKTIERFNKTSTLGRPESDAEHIWHLIMMVYLFSESREEIDKWKAVEIAMVHDLVEVYAGDVNLWEENKISQSDKQSAEDISAIKLFSLLPADLESRFYSLWKEYEERKTVEARFVYALDKLQPFIQRVVSGDNGWKEKKVDLNRLNEVKPELIKNDPEMSEMWDDLTKEAIDKKMLWGQD